MDNNQVKTSLLTLLNSQFPEVRDIADNEIGPTLLTKVTASYTFNLPKLLQAKNVKADTYMPHAKALQVMLMDKGFGCDAMFPDKVLVSIKFD